MKATKLLYNGAPDEVITEISEDEFFITSEHYVKYRKFIKDFNGYPGNDIEVYHRLGGLPAVEYSDGSKYYYEYGDYHRENDLPAIDTPSCKEWLLRSQHYIRPNGGPGFISTAEEIYYNNDGRISRLDGPAIIYYITGDEKFYINGKEIDVHSTEEFLKYLNHKLLS